MKRLSVLVFTFLFCILLAFSASAETVGDDIILDMGPIFGESSGKGDVNNDGSINSEDITALANALASGTASSLDAANVYTDDETDNGAIINIKDLIFLSQYVFRTENVFKPQGIISNLAIPVADENGEFLKTEYNGDEGLFVHVLADGELLWIQLDEDVQAGIYPSIKDSEEFNKAYSGKPCSAVQLLNGNYALISLSYNELEDGTYAGLNKDENELKNAEDSKILYTEDRIKKITFSDGIASCFRDYSSHSLCNFNFTLTDNTTIIIKNIRNKGTSNEIIEYIHYDKNVFSYEYPTLYNASIILQNNIDTSSEDALVIFAEAEDYSLIKNARIISRSDVFIDEDNYYRNYYTVYDPFTGKKTEYIAGAEYSNSYKTLSPAVAIGSVVELKAGKVDENKTVIDTLDINAIGLQGDGEILKAINEGDAKAGMVWIAGYSESDKILMLAPVGGCWNDVEEGTIESYQVDNNTVVSMIKYADTKNNNTFVQWGSMSLLTTADLASTSNYYKCYNTKVDNNKGSYKTGYAKYIKAYVVTENKTLDEGELNRVAMVIFVVHPEEELIYLTTHTTELHEEECAA